ncbi:unnamed protein product [Chondrus crispus]|uniref:Uncharacterized protein n=1 Tax=Chondrus crispus TaxID=2769 RepID=R7QRW3_CHOCR|nr:unnamed protein product [Chondrus crispus]CDF40246.1 unnamed protein product [Chondrus crispus]|eukprot:XP_005710540.1 unnamed protein product [Chondrus crispus]
MRARASTLVRDVHLWDMPLGLTDPNELACSWIPRRAQMGDEWVEKGEARDVLSEMAHNEAGSGKNDLADSLRELSICFEQGLPTVAAAQDV